MVNVKSDIRIRDIRWKKDFEEVFDLDRMNSEFPKSRKHFKELSAQQPSALIRIAAEHCGSIISSLFCMVFKKNLRLLDVLVHRNFRRQGVGSMMLGELIETIQEDGRFSTVNTIRIFVREKNLSGRLFLQKHRFRGMGVARRFYKDTGEDAYRMEFSLKR